MNKRVTTIIRWAVIIAIPFLLAVLTLQLLINWDWPSYPEFEYGRISPDRFGFTVDQRLELAEATLAYLRRSEPSEEVIYLLEELTLPENGQPLYNSREIGHMLDVKDVADSFKWVFRFLGLVVVAGLIVLLVRTETRRDGYKAIMYGGILTAAILFIMTVLILVSWNTVFVQFHEILFPPDSWTFAYSDSLIRLFPEQFWFDFGIIWTGAILLEGVVLTVIGYLLLKRGQPA